MASVASGAQGLTYEARLSALCLVRGYIRGLKDFRLEYQVNAADKFDDVVFDEGGKKYQMIQLKYKEKKEKEKEKEEKKEKEKEEEMKIQHRQLFNEKLKGDYCLLKYVKSVKSAKLSDKFKDNIKVAVLYTNIDFNLDEDNNLDLKKSQRKNDKVWYGDLASIKLTPVKLDSSAIFDTSASFGDAKFYKFTDDPNIVQILKRQSLDLKKDVGDITEDEIQDALQYIIYAVVQPSTKKLEEIIKNELIEHFKLHNADIIYNAIDKMFRDWCATKNQFDGTSTTGTKQHILTFTDADTFFQKNVKRLSYGTKAPTKLFTGREKELKEIQKTLHEQSNVMITQSLTISGLGGIGKTQLAKQFIEQFGEDEFYRRVFWIDAESDESIKKSFKLIAELLQIKSFDTKSIEILIDEVFGYFEDLKVLFVFDNFDKNLHNKGDLVKYCLDKTNNSKNTRRPYFIFTSRNREIIPGVAQLNLDVFLPTDAVDLIKKELGEVNHTKEDAERLANALNYFPLALRQATAYIKEQYQMKKVFGEQYDISKFLERFKQEKESLLHYKYPDEFGDYGRTTFISWNVTLDAIQDREVDGENAIKLLQVLAYLYADKIDSKKCTTLFENNQDNTARAFLLLEKYSIITKIDENGTFYQIHRLVQEVIQLKFKENEETILESTIKLVNPELYDNYFGSSKNTYIIANPIRLCTMDDYIHYNTLSVHVRKQPKLDTKYKSFFQDIYFVFLHDEVWQDNIDKVKALNVPTTGLKRFVTQHLDEVLRQNSNKVLTYFLQNNIFDVNDRINDESIVKICMEKSNLDMFKYLIEQGADITDIFESIQAHVIQKIINNQCDTIEHLLSTESDHKTLEGYLFIATLFNRPSVVNLLLRNATPNFKYKKWSPIFVAAKYKSTEVLTVLTDAADKVHIQDCLFDLLDDRQFSDKDMFGLIFNKYVTKGGDVNDEIVGKVSFLYWVIDDYCFNTCKTEICTFLLDKGADETISDEWGVNVLTKMLRLLKRDSYDLHSKDLFDKVFEKIFFENLTPRKFISNIVNGLFKINSWNQMGLTSVFDDLIDKIGDINKTNGKGETVLLNYLKDPKCKIENVKILVEKGVKVDISGYEDRDALYFAVELQDDIFLNLLEKVEEVKENVVIRAIELDKVSIIKKLVGKNVSFDDQFENLRKTPIEVALNNTSYKTVLFLKKQFKEYHDAGGIVNTTDDRGKTLLIKLIQDPFYRNLSNVKILVENGVDVNILDHQGKSAISYAIESFNTEIFEYLLTKVESLEGDEILVQVIERDNVSAAKILFEKVYSVNQRLSNEATPISLAIENVSFKIVLLLYEQFIEFCQNGGNVNVRDDKGETLLLKLISAIHCFKYDGNLNDVKLFVENGVDVNIRNNDGRSALYYAVQLKNDDIFLYLLDKVTSIDEDVIIKTIELDKLSILQKFSNISLDNRFSNDKTPIEIAVKNVSLKIVLHLRNQFKEYHQKGGFVNERDENGQTLLMKLIELMHLNESDEDLANVKFLVENGLDVKITDKIGKYALFLATQLENDEIFLYLLEKVKSVNETTLLASINCGKLSMVKALVPQFFKKDYRFVNLLYKNKSILKVAIENKRQDIQEFLNKCCMT